MSNSERYQGWTNRATWLVHLWLSSTEDWYHAVREMKSPEQIEDFVRELMDNEAPAGLSSDLVSVALAEVNWKEIYDAFHED
jgi:hypothetical protein